MMTEAGDFTSSDMVLLPGELQLTEETGLRRRGRRRSTSPSRWLLHRSSTAAAAAEEAGGERQQQKQQPKDEEEKEEEDRREGEGELGQEEASRTEDSTAAAEEQNRRSRPSSGRRRGEERGCEVFCSTSAAGPPPASTAAAGDIPAAALPAFSSAAAGVQPVAVCAAAAAAAARGSAAVSFPSTFSTAAAGLRDRDGTCRLPAAGRETAAEPVSQPCFSSTSSSATKAAVAEPSAAAPSESTSSCKIDASSSSAPCSAATGSQVTRLFLQVTPSIKEFLLQSSNGDAQRTAARDAVDLDCLMQWVDEHNKSCGKAKRVKIGELVEGTYIVGKEQAAVVDLSTLSASDRLRLRSEERRFQRTLRSLFGSPPEENFANYTQSLALGVNALLGVFLMFLAGYWVSEYSGVTNFTVKVTVGIICSFGCLVIEVLLLLLRDEVQQRKKGKRGAQRRYCAPQQ